jgi:hypothetical protein
VISRESSPFFLISRTALELLGDISQAGQTCELGERPGRELLPPVEAATLAVALESLAFDPVENVSVNKLKQLTTDCVTMCHGLIEISGLFSTP